jgi:hypothetical protein
VLDELMSEVVRGTGDIIKKSEDDEISHIY